MARPGGLTAKWNGGRIAQYRQRVNKGIGVGVVEALEAVRDDWAANVRVDTGHMQAEIAGAKPTLTSATSGTVGPDPVEDYFIFNEYGTSRMSANPAMRQAEKAGQAKLRQAIAQVLSDAIGSS
jgi:HK97 gp10 family phage protein